ncbi:Retinol dehydrogenase 12 [Chionoecetes opilio]|uniref:Retinol dehydrogenase 12 n=1 Tax=Chionoecetes opilio TaxID=41210 RepID=A0A8J4YRP6_CHIOP|nr:Retinol dehydrogenase 12 [Chionoecetes opilio]
MSPSPAFDSGHTTLTAHLHLCPGLYCPWCRNVPESIEHFLLLCPRLHSHRQLLCNQLIALNVTTFNLPTLLSLLTAAADHRRNRERTEMITVHSSNIQVFSLHPGSVQSNLSRHIVNKGNLPTGRLSALLMKTTVEGIQTTLYCALEAQQQEPYYYSDCNIAFTIKAARDDALAERLWLVSEEMVGLSKTSELSPDSKTQ